MLQKLHIFNYALIEKLDIDFSQGFSVITGETGAGKSIILGALGLLLGGRSDAKSIKPGSSKCCVEGIFDLEDKGLDSFFEENDIDFDGKECILRRELTQAGKTRAFVNDSPVALGKLKELASHLIDIHSQHQNLLMTNELFLLETLDVIGNCQATHQTYQHELAEWQECTKQLEELRQKSEKGQADADYLQFQFEQLSEAQLQEGEQDELEKESEMLAHAEEIKTTLYKVTSSLDSDENPLVHILRTAESTLGSLEKYLPETENLVERLRSVRIELEDVLGELNNLSESVDYNPHRLQEVDERLSLLYSLQKKHHVDSVKALMQLRDEIDEQLCLIENFDEVIAQKEHEANLLHQAVAKSAKQLTQQRKEAAKQIEIELTEALHSLGMPSVQLSFDFSERAAYDRSGNDKVVFLFSANKNVPMQDVASIASGGEIARLMLSLKTLLSAHLHLPTIVFDEIDTGVSGTMAEKMALQMKKLSERCQVLCITHLPQIAALGDVHYRVYKEETENGTSSHLIQLTSDERVLEIANMLSGSEMTEAAINNAKSLLKQ